MTVDLPSIHRLARSNERKECENSNHWKMYRRHPACPAAPALSFLTPFSTSTALRCFGAGAAL